MLAGLHMALRGGNTREIRASESLRDAVHGFREPSNGRDRTAHGTRRAPRCAPAEAHQVIAGWAIVSAAESPRRARRRADLRSRPTRTSPAFGARDRDERGRPAGERALPRGSSAARARRSPSSVGRPGRRRRLPPRCLLRRPPTSMRRTDRPRTGRSDASTRERVTLSRAIPSRRRQTLTLSARTAPAIASSAARPFAVSAIRSISSAASLADTRPRSDVRRASARGPDGDPNVGDLSVIHAKPRPNGPGHTGREVVAAIAEVAASHAHRAPHPVVRSTVAAHPGRTAYRTSTDPRPMAATRRPAAVPRLAPSRAPARRRPAARSSEDESCPWVSASRGR